VEVVEEEEVEEEEEEVVEVEVEVEEEEEEEKEEEEEEEEEGTRRSILPQAQPELAVDIVMELILLLCRLQTAVNPECCPVLDYHWK
jgi:hypothetical protein